MCYCLKVSRSAYYVWDIDKQSTRAIETELISEEINQIFKNSRQTYGTRRIRRGLRKQGFWVSRRRIGKLMNKLGLYCKTKKKFRVTTDSKHLLPVADNLLNREFSVDQPNTCYVGDMTYIYTSSGWLYLAVVIDLFSRKVVGWSMADNMKAELVNSALHMAIQNRG